MTVTSFVAPRTGKIIKNRVEFLKEQRICYKMVYYTVFLGSVNRQKLSWKVRI